MFKSVEEVNNTDLGVLVKLVSESGGSADYSVILDEETSAKYYEAKSVILGIEQHAERIAFAIRDRIESEGVEDDLVEEDGYYEGEEVLTSFMQAIAQESGEIYTDYDCETHPDSFWTPSSC